MPKSVSVVAVLEQSTTNVHEKAREAFARDLAAYRAGCESMAEHDMQLPEDKADELLEVCGRLGITAERLAADATAFIKLRNINARIAVIEERNAARRAPLPELAAKLAEANAEFLRVRPECLRRIQQVETALNAAQRAHDAVAHLRDERTDREQGEMLEVRNRFPHLFQELTPDELRKYLARS